MRVSRSAPSHFFRRLSAHEVSAFWIREDFKPMHGGSRIGYCVMAQSGATCAYFWLRIWRQLVAQGIRVGKQRARRLMQKHGIQDRGKRKFRVTTTYSRHDLPHSHCRDATAMNRNLPKPAG